MMGPRIHKTAAGLLLIMLMSLIFMMPALGQDNPPPAEATPTLTPALMSLTMVEPGRIVRGTATSVTLRGENFSSDVSVTIGGRAVQTSFQDPTRLTVVVPQEMSSGRYDIVASSPGGGSVTMTAGLQVSDPVPAAISVTSSEPIQIMPGQARMLSVFGSNFPTGSTIRIEGFGLIATTVLDGGRALTAEIPSSIPPGNYRIIVTTPDGQNVASPNNLNVIFVLTPQPTMEPTTPPTMMPGEPSLTIQGFSSDPAEIEPGATARLSFIVTNRGNRAAQGVTISLGSGSSFVPDSGQASITLANLPPGASAPATMIVRAGMDAKPGPISVPLRLSYFDNSGESYSNDLQMGVVIKQTVRSSQISLAGYLAQPSPARPGEPVTVLVDVANTGTEIARQVSLRVTGSSSVLLAGLQGDIFPLGDIEPNRSVSRQLPLIVSMDAKPGPRPQSVTLSYVQDGETKTVEASITIDVGVADTPTPLLLLSSYDPGVDRLQPGDRFTLNVSVTNVGNGDAPNTLLSFGTVEGRPDSGGEGGSGGSANPPSNPTSANFAPLGTGGSHFVGTIAAANGTVDVSQEFLVAGNITSGIYNLPITLEYPDRDGETVRQLLYASLVVVVPPRLQMTLQQPLPDMLNVGEPVPVALELVNKGTLSVNLLGARAEVDNGTIFEGATSVLSPLKTDEDALINVLLAADAEGPVEVRIIIEYLDGLNQRQTIVESYTAEAMLPVEQPIDFFPPEPEPVEEPVAEDDLIQRLLFGLLGLGS